MNPAHIPHRWITGTANPDPDAFPLAARIAVALLALSIVALVALTLALVPVAWAGDAPSGLPPAGTPFEFKVPIGLEDPPVPADNPMTVEKVALGRQLYFDPRLSKDNTVSCATCHDPTRGWTDQLAVSTGVGGKQGTRSSPTVLNTAYQTFQFWDGRAGSLEEQALGPIENPVEMAESLDNVVQKLSAVPAYRAQFAAVFGTDVTRDGIAKAIAAFERTALAGNSRWDQYEAGDKSAMSAAEVRGLELFRTKANCNACHAGFNMTDDVFHNIGTGMVKQQPDLGRHLVTKQDKDRGAFKTPTLRDITRTAPYLHDGSEPTLESVVEYYNKGGFANPWLDVQMKPLNLTDSEKQDLVAFLKALDSQPPLEIAPPDLPQ